MANPASKLAKFWHRIEHRLGWNGGRVESMTTPEGRILIGFMCNGCGELSGVHDATVFIDRHLEANLQHRSPLPR